MNTNLLPNPFSNINESTPTANINHENLRKLINSNVSRNIKIDGKSYWIGAKLKNELKKHELNEGGFFPLLAAIPALIAGLGAAKIAAIAGGAAGVAGGIATVVSQSRLAEKTKNELEAQAKDREAQSKIEKQKRELEVKKQELEVKKLDREAQIINQNTSSGYGLTSSLGHGIFLNPHQGSAIHKYLKNIITKQELKKLTKNFKHGIKITLQGDGIFLNPYKQD